ncbi:hypothetical protein N7509_009060 [Penicillium cosmopolitanum]|uniref:Aromatic-L-amino-acid decarboxylase n=1 Tax=Penicillium cosmopolitanum TaxID=1131564 RepID=A0A9W9VNU8_9EURO|nr:uncharacterized protein N7509_009060 [Penicillium cosmopolitanum]KAJ5386519.1 hypothetical protein N7509_009060 [Penicillium cosmopolitanum]
MDQSQFRAAAHSAIDDIISHFDSMPEKRVLPTVEPGYLRSLVPENPPDEPEEWAAIQKDIDSKIKPGLTHWQSPNFMAYFPAGVTYPSILGEMYSATFNAPAFNWLCSPACTELETIVMDWMAKAFGLPECFLSSSKGGGVIQNSASDAIATVITAARERRARELALADGMEEDTPEYEDRKIEHQGKLVAIASDQTHSSAAKGALIAGTRFRSVQTQLVDNMEMTAPRLRKVLEKCEESGLIPYHLTMTLGTTNSCSMDRYAEILALLSEKPEWQRIWVHVDAAYAGASLITEECSHIAKNFAEGVDSFNMNMHKWLLVNFDASLLFVRNRVDLTNAFDMTPAYLRNAYSDSGALRLEWHEGIYSQDHGPWNIYADLIRGRSDLFEIVTKPAFGLTVFRVKNPQATTNGSHETNGTIALCKRDKESDSLTKKVYELVNSRGEIFITSTVIDGVYVIRVVSTNPMAEEKYVRNAFDIIVRTTEEVLQQET